MSDRKSAGSIHDPIFDLLEVLNRRMAETQADWESIPEIDRVNMILSDHPVYRKYCMDLASYKKMLDTTVRQLAK